jgi:exodeoxyribonuclease-5
MTATATQLPATMLNPEQAAAIDSIRAWLADEPNPFTGAGGDSSPFFVLSGSAGTGKTFCVRELLQGRSPGRFIFTAPTNKATKVLRSTLTTRDYRPETKTIYSLLGLRLESTGEVRELAVPEEPIDLARYRAVIVDEGSMVNSNLMEHIRRAAEESGTKFLFMGDAAQLPPVGESTSPIWTLVKPQESNYAKLQTVMRHDNQILELATRLRRVVDHPVPTVRLDANNDGEQGVWRAGNGAFERKILEAVDDGDFSRPDRAKAIAWRNVTVDRLNVLIRGKLFDNSSSIPWMPTDRVIFTAPAADLEGENLATTDDEGVVERVDVGQHPLEPEFKVFNLSLTMDDNRLVQARVLHHDSLGLYNRRLDQLSREAKLEGRKWKQFWAFKELFHQLRYAYAVTAHRAQGSTYDTAFVDWQDILLNRNRQEGYRCLYVACTRPKRRLVLA